MHCLKRKLISLFFFPSVLGDSFVVLFGILLTTFLNQQIVALNAERYFVISHSLKGQINKKSGEIACLYIWLEEIKYSVNCGVSLLHCIYAEEKGPCLSQ